MQWAGPTPPEWLDDLAVLIGRMSTDAPTGDLTLEPQRWDADRVRERDAVAVRERRALGRHRRAGRRRAPRGVHRGVHLRRARTASPSQGDTLVARAHRGHRLGLRIKLANLELLLREHPEVRAIDTFNADDNRWMIAVNEAMGFVPIHRRATGSWTWPPAQAGTTAAISAAASGP